VLKQPEISVVVPLHNEGESIRLLVEGVRSALESRDWELLLVDDGSTDDTGVLAEELAREDSRVRAVRLARNFGQTKALQAGFDHVSGAVVVTMDGDLQNDPRDIPGLVRTLESGYDLVAGYRADRQDRLLTRKMPSRVANMLVRRLTGVPIRDNGCSLKAYSKDLVERLHLYSDFHRFIPALAATTAGARITEVPVRHHARKFGESKYGLSRVWKVVADLLTLKMLHSFRERPLAVFSAMALVALFFAIVCAVVSGLGLIGVVVLRSVVVSGLAVLLFGVAFYLLLLGLIGEVSLREESTAGTQVAPLLREKRLRAAGKRARR